MRTDSENKKGFTIVELVMVTAIIAFISTIGAAGYRQGERRVVLDNQTFQFMQDVRRAQERALSSRDTGAAAPGGYGVYCRPRATIISFTRIGTKIKNMTTAKKPSGFFGR